ncbi:hypothetical protein B0H17DRAFT_1238187 [Mycena rosella]|uniref:Uncharacterized protein n=1 Tax=Mycena rosella TaxID=1033263 RepID=A0AAD7D3G0_MYCRO|nr:hypothetical protein B0H17DRAFT_1238187 [Mycena rosella]
MSRSVSTPINVVYSTKPPITLNPQLAHHRSPLHPHLDWDAAKSPLDANLQHGSAQFKIGDYQLEQYASTPPVKSLALTFAGAAASNLGHRGTIHVERRDGRSLCVGGVLNAISVHLTRQLKWEEIQGMDTDKWERVVGVFNFRSEWREFTNAAAQLVRRGNTVRWDSICLAGSCGCRCYSTVHGLLQVSSHNPENCFSGFFELR